MNINKIWAVSFSPTGNTKKAVQYIAEQLSDILHVSWKNDSFTLPEDRIKERRYTASDLVVFAIPTYAGRIPNKILPAVQTLFFGNHTPVVPVVTFGNRSFDNSLKELRNELAERDFHPIGAAAVVTKHVFSDVLGAGRPDDRDLSLLQFLASDIAFKVRSASNCLDLLPPVLPDDKTPVGPYYTPLQEDGTPAVFLKAKPVVDHEQCRLCNICAQVCPMGSIPVDHPDTTTGICIKCHACIQACPHHARKFQDPAMLSHTKMLEAHFRRRASSAVFLSELSVQTRPSS